MSKWQYDWAATFTNWETFRSDYGLIHLWFLYILLLLYAATVACQIVVQRVVDRQGRMQAACAGILTRILQSPWSVLWLAVATTLVNLPPNWDIVPTPGKLTPHRTSFLTYWLFFGVG